MASSCGREAKRNDGAERRANKRAAVTAELPDGRKETIFKGNADYL